VGQKGGGQLEICEGCKVSFSYH